jgi:hypothetical protein
VNLKTLTLAQVTQIKASYIPGTRWCPGNEVLLAHQFGVNRSHIGNIVQGRKWA